MTKTSFWPLFDPEWPVLGPTDFNFQHSNHHHLLDRITLYHNMQNQQKRKHIEQENGLKPDLATFWAKMAHFRASKFFQPLDNH